MMPVLVVAPDYICAKTWADSVKLYGENWIYINDSRKIMSVENVTIHIVKTPDTIWNKAALLIRYWATLKINSGRATRWTHNG